MARPKSSRSGTSSVPSQSDGQVLVRVRAASVNRGDLDGLTPKPGFVRLFIGLRAPRDPRVGIDVAGVVEAVGPGVTRLKAGDQVMTDMFATGRFGAFAEYVCARESAFETIPAWHVVRGGLDPSARRDPRAPGAADAPRPHGQARRPGADRRRVGERRSVRGPDREVARRGGDGRVPDREDGEGPRSSVPTTSSITRRSTTPGPASDTTGSSTPTPTTRSSASGAPCGQRACTSRSVATRPASSEA